MQSFQYIAEPEIGPDNIDKLWFNQGEIFAILSSRLVAVGNSYFVPYILIFAYLLN